MADYRYYDEATGQEVSAEEAQTGQIVYDNQTDQPPEQSPGFWNTTAAVFGSFPSRIARGVGGLVQAGEENLGFDLPYIGKETVDKANDVQNVVENYWGIPQQGRARMAYEIAGGLLPTAMSVAASGGAAAPVLISEGLRGYGDIYQGLRQQDVSPGLSAVGAGVETGVNTIAGKFGLDAVLGPGKSILGRTLRGTLANVATSPFTTGARIGVEEAVGAKDYTPAEVRDNLVQDVIGNAVSGAALGPVGELSMRGSVRPVDSMSVSDFVKDIEAKSSPTADVAPSGIDITPKGLPAPSERLALPAPPEAIQMGFSGDVSGSPIQLDQGPSEIPAKTRLPDPKIIGEKPIVNEPDLVTGSAYRARTEEEIASAKKVVAEVQTENTLNKIKQGDPTLVAGAIKDLTTPRIVAPDGNPAEKSFPRAVTDENATSEKLVEKASVLDNESGKLSIDLTPIKDAFDKITESVKAWNTPELSRGAASERYFQGYARNNGMFQDVRVPWLGTVRELRNLPAALAKKFPVWDPVYQAGKEQLALENQVSGDIHKQMQAYWKLPDTNNVDKFLAADREVAQRAIAKNQTPPPMTDAYLRSKGFSDAEIDGVKAFRAGMNKALDYLEQSFLADGRNIQDPKQKTDYEQQVTDYINLLRKSRYAPFSRFGKRFDVTTTDASGNVLYREFFDSRGDALKAAREQKKTGNNVAFEEMPGQDPAAYEDFAFKMLGGKAPKEFDPSKFRPGEAPLHGFVKHLAPAALIPGYEKNMRRSASDYVLGLSKYASKKIAADSWDKALSGIDPAKENSLAAEAKKYREWIDAPANKVTSGILRLSNFMTLAGVPVSALTNATQPLVNTYPALLKYQNPFKAGRTMASSGKVVMDYMYAKSRDWLGGGEQHHQDFIKKHGELGAFIEEGVRRGTLEAVASHDLSRMRQGKESGSIPLDQKAMLAFKSVEEMNRISAFASGYKVGKEKGLQGDALFKFAEDFTNLTQFDQSKANYPKAMRNGASRVALQYKGYLLNQMHFLRQHMQPGEYKVVLASLGMQTLLGGAVANPIIQAYMNLSEAGENDPKAEFRKFVKDPDYANAILYGAPTLAGVNISANVSSELMPSLDRGAAGVIKSLAGPTFGNLERIPKAVDAYKRGENWIAAETLMPRFARGPSKAVRAYMNGELKDSRGAMLLRDPSAIDLAVLATGASPQEVIDAYEIRHSQDVLSRKFKDNDYYNLRIGKALADGDTKTSSELQQEMIQRGLKPNMSSIRNAYLNAIAPELAREKSIPKAAKAGAREIERNVRGR